jgi:hypothetical protein
MGMYTLGQLGLAEQRPGPQSSNRMKTVVKRLRQLFDPANAQTMDSSAATQAKSD